MQSRGKERPLIRRLGDFVAWWGSELSAMLPIGLKRFFQVDYFCLDLNVSEKTLRLHDSLQNETLQLVDLKSNPGPMPVAMGDQLAKIDSRLLEQRLVFDEEQVLSFHLQLPAEAEGNIRDLLVYEMDRLTPFKAEQVYYDFWIEKSGPGAERLDVNLVVVPRGRVEDGIAQAARLGMRPAAVTVVKSSGQDKDFFLPLNLLPAERRITRPMGLYRLNWLLVLSLLVMMSLSVGGVLIGQDHRMELVQQEIDDMADSVRQAQQIRQQIEGLVAHTNGVVHEKQQSTDLLAILNELSDTIPSDTWLTRFDLNGRTLKLQGESVNASKLIGLLDSSDRFQDVSFVSPVVRDARTGNDRFQLTLVLTGNPVN